MMYEGLNPLPLGLLVTVFLWEIILFSIIGPVTVLAIEVYENKRRERDPRYLQLKKYRDFFKKPGEELDG